MSEERFDRIDARLDGVDIRLDGIDVRLDRIEADVSGLKTEVAGLRVEVRDVSHQMLILHEDLVDRIKAIPDPTDAIRREMKAGLADLREETNRRLDPLEWTVRDLSRRTPH